MKKYFGKSSAEIEEIENRYNFIPVETNQAAVNKSLSQVCVNAVRDIAQTKSDGMETEKLESQLREYRDYAVGNGGFKN